jgi:Bacterial tandem repeat domain 1
MSAYIDTDGTVKYAVIMAPADQEWWWWSGLTGAQVGQYLTQYKARLTDISAYLDTGNEVKFAVIMAPADQEWWWYYGLTPAQVGQNLTQNKARLAVVSPFLMSTTNSITINSYPNVSGLNGSVTLTIEDTGAYSFSGGWSPSNVFTGIVSQDVNLVLTLRDIRGTVWVFSTAGNVPSEGSYNFNDRGTNASLARNWPYLAAAYSWHDEYSGTIDLTASWNDIVQWYNQNKQTINQVVQVAGWFAAAVGLA